MKTKEVAHLKEFSQQAVGVNKVIATTVSGLKEMVADFKADEGAGGKDLVAITRKVNALGDKLPGMVDEQSSKLEPLATDAALKSSKAGKQMFQNVQNMDGEFRKVEKDSDILTDDFQKHQKQIALMGKTKTAPKWYLSDEKVIGDAEKQMEGIQANNLKLKGLADSEIKNHK
jgi:hypothetical protein